MSVANQPSSPVDLELIARLKKQLEYAELAVCSVFHSHDRLAAPGAPRVRSDGDAMSTRYVYDRVNILSAKVEILEQ